MPVMITKEMAVAEKKFGIGQLFSHEGLILASVPFLGSCVSYLFEVAYLKHFNAPISLIKMDVTKIMSANIAIGVLSAIFIGAAITVIRFFSDSNKTIVRAFAGPLVNTMVAAAFVGISPVQHKVEIIIGIFIVLLVNQYGWALFLGRNGERYSIRLRKQIDETGHFGSLPITGIPLAISVVFFAGSLLVGYSQKYAEIKTNYFVDSVDETKFLIEMYDDVAIFGRYDPLTRELENGVTIQKLEGDNLSLTIKSIGPLKNPHSPKDIFEAINGKLSKGSKSA